MGAITLALKEEHRIIKRLIRNGLRSGESLPDAVKNAYEAYKKTRPENEVLRLALAGLLQEMGFNNLEIEYDPDSGDVSISANVQVNWK